MGFAYLALLFALWIEEEANVMKETAEKINFSADIFFFFCFLRAKHRRIPKAMSSRRVSASSRHLSDRKISPIKSYKRWQGAAQSILISSWQQYLHTQKRVVKNFRPTIASSYQNKNKIRHIEQTCQTRWCSPLEICPSISFFCVGRGGRFLFVYITLDGIHLIPSATNNAR